MSAGGRLVVQEDVSSAVSPVGRHLQRGTDDEQISANKQTGFLSSAVSRHSCWSQSCSPDICPENCPQSCLKSAVGDDVTGGGVWSVRHS